MGRIPVIVSQQSGVQGNSDIIVLPTHSIGDMLLIFVSTEYQGADLDPSFSIGDAGWVKITGDRTILGGNRFQSSVWYKIANGSDNFYASVRPLNYIGYSLSNTGNAAYGDTLYQSTNTGNVRPAPRVSPGFVNAYLAFTSLVSRLQTGDSSNTLGNNLYVDAGFTETQNNTAQGTYYGSSWQPPSWVVDDEEYTLTSTVLIPWDKVLTKLTIGVPNGKIATINGDVSKPNLIIKD